MAGAAYPTRPAGPCTPWCTAQDVFGLVSPSLPDDVDLNAAIEAASWLLWSLSGRQFSGGCIMQVRPNRVGCSCWGPGGPGAPDQNGVNLALAGADWWFGGYGGGGVPGWTNDCGDQGGCGTLSSVTLDGYPVTAIDQVLIDGDVVDPDTYRLDANRYLVRLVDPSSGNQLHWPACQDMARPPTAGGTWEVTYEYGSPPPALGIMAAAELALQFFYASTGNKACKLPSGVTKIVRQGITIERLVPMFVTGQRTGLVLPDAFLAGVNPNGLRRRPAVMSPGVPRYPRRTTR